MSKATILKYLVCLFIPFLFLYSCGSNPAGEITLTGILPGIDPDYSGITIPPNIAPMNFVIREQGKTFIARFSDDSGTLFESHSTDGVIIIPTRKWTKMLKDNKGKEFMIDIFVKDSNGIWSAFKTISNKISPDPIDPYISYRILYPGYESWKELSIRQRNLGSFSERSIIENSGADDNCVNCHAFNNGKTDDFLFHMRGSMGGTYFYTDGKFQKHNLKTDELKNGAVYPRWHPSGKFVAFSTNRIIQQFHAADNKKVEVSDLESSLVLYDIEKNEISGISLTDSDQYMDTYPEWSPEGDYLYFCRAAIVEEPFDYQQIRYDLCRVPFNQSTCKFGEATLIYNASEQNKSISFPRISPDGRYMIITLHNYGCFPIWHKEADLVSIDLESFNASKPELNSDFTDSYHSWSSNGRWLVFSSKRIDGLTARPFIAWIDGDGNSGKPFILPQKDPEFYQTFLKSYNIPEFSTLRIDTRPGRIMKTAKGPAIQVQWSGN